MNDAQDGLTSLYSAVNSGHAGVVKLLIDAGANINQATKVIPLVIFGPRFLCMYACMHAECEHLSVHLNYKYTCTNLCTNACVNY